MWEVYICFIRPYNAIVNTDVVIRCYEPTCMARSTNYRGFYVHTRQFYKCERSHYTCHKHIHSCCNSNVSAWWYKDGFCWPTNGPSEALVQRGRVISVIGSGLYKHLVQLVAVPLIRQYDTFQRTRLPRLRTCQVPSCPIVDGLFDERVWLVECKHKRVCSRHISCCVRCAKEVCVECEHCEECHTILGFYEESTLEDIFKDPKYLSVYINK